MEKENTTTSELHIAIHNKNIDETEEFMEEIWKLAEKKNIHIDMFLNG